MERTYLPTRMNKTETVGNIDEKAIITFEESRNTMNKNTIPTKIFNENNP